MELVKGLLAGGAVVRSDFGRLALCFLCGGGEGGDMVLTGDPKPESTRGCSRCPGRSQLPTDQSSVGGGMGRRSGWRRPLQGSARGWQEVVREVSWVTEVSALGGLMEKGTQTGTGRRGGDAVSQWRWRLVRRWPEEFEVPLGLGAELPVGLVYMVGYWGHSFVRRSH